MRRPRLSPLATAIAIAAAAVPILGAVALAADPTITVRSGDTLSGIAERTGVTVTRLVELNALRDPDLIFPGQRLKVDDEAETPDTSPVAAEPIVHVVQRGESVWGIAHHYGVSVSAVVAANGLADPGRIFGGQRLTIPGVSQTVAPAGDHKTDLPAPMASAVADRDGVRRMIIAEADRYGVPSAFALAVAWQESGWRQGVVSYAGAIGVMQLLPATAEWVGTTMLGRAVDVHDAHDNVQAGVRLLAHYLERYGGDRGLVLAAYYQGQTSVDRHGIYSVSRPYIASIRALEELFGG